MLTEPMVASLKSKAAVLPIICPANVEQVSPLAASQLDLTSCMVPVVTACWLCTAKLTRLNWSFVSVNVGFVTT